VGYGDAQLADLQKTIERARDGGAQAVAIGTPVDLARVVDISLPHTRVRYGLQLVEAEAMLLLMRIHLAIGKLH
jgi:hypothetical protein